MSTYKVPVDFIPVNSLEISTSINTSDVIGRVILKPAYTSVSHHELAICKPASYYTVKTRVAGAVVKSLAGSAYNGIGLLSSISRSVRLLINEEKTCTHDL